ncbi:MAG: hypothetical protein GY762_16905 [Proteobacteria bacterium]|nr:hypothetical protein [Pseudomonadota bacterium]
MSKQSTSSFQPNDEVIWWKRIPGGPYVYPVPATVLKVTAKRVQIEGDDDGRRVVRYVPPESLQKRDEPAPDPSFTPKQGQYLAYIHNYTKINGEPPAERDMQGYFLTTPPNVHDMILRLEQKGLIERTPGRARSIRILIPPADLPPLE